MTFRAKVFFKKIFTIDSPPCSLAQQPRGSLSLVPMLAFSLALIALSACQSDNRSSDKNLLVYCAEGSPDSFNPQTVTSGTSIDASSATIYNQLLDYKPGSSELRPSLATNWQISKDGLRYLFTLRQGVKFHANEYFTPTRDLNAQDIIFSINRQRQTEHPMHTVSGGHYPYFQSQGLGKLIKEVNEISPYQVEFVLSRPESPFLSILATPFLPIQSKEYAEHLLQQNKSLLYDVAPIGTGPFQYVDYEVDSYIRFQRFEQHFAGASAIKNLVYSITPDAAMRFARFSAGECDLMRYPLPVHLKLASQQEQLVTVQTPGLNVAYWAFNTAKKPFDQPAVRQALSLAINREAIIRSVYDQQAVLAHGPLPPSSWAYNENPEKISYNPEKARQLLVDAGYENNLKLDIWAMPVQRAYNPNARKMAEMIQQDLEEVGVEAQIVTYQWGTFLRKVKFGEHQTVLLGWNADNGDPNNFLTPLLSCLASLDRSNYARWCNSEFDQAIMQAREEPEPSIRQQHYRQAQHIFNQQLPWLPLAHAQNSLLLQKRIQGLSLSPLGAISFEGIRFTEINSAKTSNESTPSKEVEQP